MARMNFARRAALLGAMAMLAAGAAQAQTKERKPDLADAVAGTYHGDVISDSKGSSRSNVTLTVTRTGPNADPRDEHPPAGPRRQRLPLRPHQEVARRQLQHGSELVGGEAVASLRTPPLPPHEVGGERVG